MSSSDLNPVCLTPRLNIFSPRQQRLDNRREKARLRMARKRAELKQRPLEEQQEAAERARLHQAAYRERHRNDLRLWEAQRRVEMYKKRFGPEAYHAYAKLKRDRKRRAREKKRAKEGYYDEQQPRPPHQQHTASQRMIFVA